ncbi:transcriptional regulator GcvA [Labrys wisconsinensis]|uniref:LysR family glycine cleavage system transcriptional activator n=1 Tax=Labrys wisconsinensis TaxID=425677 RepID=A0ABU0JCT7_9HYPH|nr:transcriptional regulator GcvA [Labrys wisconsinensis]MDQ0472103.1 LysR family glycine cleavage system transcriptional activator [Labrys wisconsinensis]
MDTPRNQWLEELITGAPNEHGRQRRQAPRLPPLNLFRVFEAAARHRSFRGAADELCVTPSAVSQQIRQLEDFLGARLFRRLPRQVELTRDGTTLANVVQEALILLSKVCGRLGDPAASTVLCINVSTSLASRWLVNRLGDFMAEHPQIKITLLASNDPVNFRRQDVDVAIRWGTGDWKSDILAEPLTRDYHFPVCSPQYRDEHDLRTPASLKRATTLHEVHGSPWTSWIDAAEGEPLSYGDVLYFSDAALMLEAAVAGQGVCLSNYILAGKDLAAGRLVAPFETTFDLGTEGYYILTSVAFAEKPAVEVLRAWLRREAQDTVGRLAGDRLRATLTVRGKQPAPSDHA